MWRYDNPAGGQPSVSVAEGSKALMQWYSRTCRHPPGSFVQQYIRKRGGGSPYSWANFGCHQVLTQTQTLTPTPTPTLTPTLILYHQVRGHPTPIPEKDANFRREDANYRSRSAGGRSLGGGRDPRWKAGPSTGSTTPAGGPWPPDGRRA